MNDSMNCAEIEAALPRLLEGEIEMDAAMRAHLDRCADCRALLADLREIVARSAALTPLQPARDLWPEIEARIQAPVMPLSEHSASRVPRLVSWRVAGLAAAAAVVVAVGLTYEMTRRSSGGTPDAGRTVAQAPTPGTTTSVIAPVSLPTSGAPATYDREVAQLHAIVDSGRARLDPATVAILDRNLRVIDSAIVQCREALVHDPASEFLLQSLNDSYRTKVRLLRIAAAATRG